MATRVAAIGEVLQLQIDGLGHDGQGVGRWRDMALFVPGALPGEQVSVRVRRVARRHLEADLIGVESASPQRIRPACILAERCGGCSLQHCSDAAQNSLKTDQVIQALRRIGQLQAPVASIWHAEAALGYRNRALIPLERTPDGVLRAGYYRRGSHRIVNMNRCPVLDPRIDGLIEPLKADLEDSGWPVDVNLTGSGGLRHLALRVGHHSDDVLITLVSSHDQLPGLQALAQRWQERWPQVVGVGLNLQPKASNVVLGPETRTIAGRSWLRESFAGLELHIGADTFFQVNTPQAERVVPLLERFFQPGPSVPLVDAYSGIGTFSLPLAAAGSPVLGLEAHERSVQQANANASRNGLSHARFEHTDVEAVLAERLHGCGGLLVDPPRKGLSPATVAAILQALPARLAYISCNPATLARDLQLLCAAGDDAPTPAPYRLLQVQPVDFFPQTSHVECVALLERV
jgi:23S rRNA (uracil1939-C5)-methyltransferase